LSLENIKFEKSQLRANAQKDMRLIKPSEKLFYEKKLTEMNLSFLGSSQTIAGYYPINNELNILPLLQLLSSIGYQIVLPCITEKKILDFRIWNMKKSLVKNRYKIHEPVNGILSIPEIVLVPGLLFDKSLHRLGYGGGFYDRTIQYYRQKDKTKFIGICYPAQIIPKLPRAEHDQKLDFLVNLDEM
jgi:5-formyltetrahydrofolate cyclo-ligase|tara:strand:+ start:749 stop:1309 length:561 start_codon:yes stop_codon:yes gene_type:complete